MKLISSGASPFVRKARTTILETGLSDVVAEIPVLARPDQANEAIIAANPLGKIPALIRDDGRAIFDSNVICRFLNDRAGSDLYPQDRLYDVLTLEALADGIMEAAVGSIYEKRFRSEDKIGHDWLRWQWSKIERALDAADSEWMDLLDAPLNAGQIAMGCALGYLDFRHGDRDWRNGRAALSAWYAGFAERPAMQATAPKD